MMNQVFVTTITIFALAFCMTDPILTAQERESNDPSHAESVQTSRQVSVRFSDGEDKPLHFLQFLPANYDTDAPQPLMLFLHGRGECGNDLQLVRKWGPPRLVDDQPDFPFILISPQCSTRGWDIVALKGLLNQVVAELNVDVSRIYITGLSMGGYGTWKFAATHPESIAAAIPICGGGHAAIAETLVNVPIWAFHGDADTVVPPSASQNLVAAIKDQGGEQITLTIYEDVGHNSWEQTYGNPEIYKWLLKHRREQNQ